MQLTKRLPNRLEKRTPRLRLNLKLALTLLVLSWLIFAFLLYPNFNLLFEVFWIDGQFSTVAFERLFNSQRAMNSLRNSFLLAFSMIVTTNILGIFCILATEYFEVKGAKLLRLAYMSPLVYSGVVFVASFNFLYGSNGIVTRILYDLFPYMNRGWFQGFGTVLFVTTFAGTYNHMIFLKHAIRGIDYQTIEAAKSMGASPWNILRKVVLPVLKPNIMAITVLVFLIGLSATSAPMIIGGQQFQTINPLIITFARNINTRDLAAALSLVLGLATIVVLAITKKIEAKTNYLSVSKVKTSLVKQKIENPLANFIVHLLAYLIFAIYALPVVLVILFSFADPQSIATGNFAWDRLTLENYLSLFTQSDAFRPYLISIIYSGLAALMVVAIVLVVVRLLHKYKKKLAILEYFMMIPWLLPSTLIAVALMVTYDRPSIWIGNQVLVGSYAMLLFAYVIVLIPFTLRMLKASFYSIDSSLEEASKSMGAGSFRTFFKVVLPTILPTILSVIAMNFNNQMADFDLTLMLFHPFVEPLGIVIMSATGENAGINARVMLLVYTVVLMAMSTLVLCLVNGAFKKPNWKRKNS